MTNILVGISLNERQDHLLAYALWLAQRLSPEVQINLLSVLDYSLTPPPYLMAYIEKEQQQNRRLLSTLSDKIKAFGVDSVFTIASGRLIESFNAAIRELNARFLVLGYKGHIVRQSSSEKMIRGLNIPMLVVRGMKSEKATMDSLSIRHILCVTDFSDNSLRAFELIKRLFRDRSHGIKVTIVNVVSSIKIEELFGKIKDIDASKRVNYCNDLLKSRQNKLDALNASGMEVTKLCRVGVPYEVINAIALEQDVDIIFMGAKGITSIDGIRIGSVTESVIKTSSCPVMVVT